MFLSHVIFLLVVLFELCSLSDGTKLASVGQKKTYISLHEKFKAAVIHHHQHKERQNHVTPVAAKLNSNSYSIGKPRYKTTTNSIKKLFAQKSNQSLRLRNKAKLQSTILAQKSKPLKRKQEKTTKSKVLRNYQKVLGGKRTNVANYKGNGLTSARSAVKTNNSRRLVYGHMKIAPKVQNLMPGNARNTGKSWDSSRLRNPITGSRKRMISKLETGLKSMKTQNELLAKSILNKKAAVSKKSPLNFRPSLSKRRLVNMKTVRPNSLRLRSKSSVNPRLTTFLPLLLKQSKNSQRKIIPISRKFQRRKFETIKSRISKNPSYLNVLNLIGPGCSLVDVSIQSLFNLKSYI